MTHLAAAASRIFGPTEPDVLWRVRCERCDRRLAETELEEWDREEVTTYTCPSCHQPVLVVRPEEGAPDAREAPRSWSEQGIVVYAENPFTLFVTTGRIEVAGNGLPPT